jgi:hypothetical protein
MSFLLQRIGVVLKGDKRTLPVVPELQTLVNMMNL